MRWMIDRQNYQKVRFTSIIILRSKHDIKFKIDHFGHFLSNFNPIAKETKILIWGSSWQASHINVFFKHLYIIQDFNQRTINTKMCVESTIIQENSDNSGPQGKPSRSLDPGHSEIEHEILGTRMNFGRWSSYQHRRFISLYQDHGNNWKAIAQYLKTTTPQQVRSHAQKFQNKKMKKQEQEKDKLIGLKEFEEAPHTTTTRSQRRLRLGKKNTFKRVKETQEYIQQKVQDNQEKQSQNKKGQISNEIKIDEIQFEEKQIEPVKKNGSIEIPIAKNGLNYPQQDQQSIYLINIVKFAMQIRDVNSNQMYSCVSHKIFNWKFLPGEFQNGIEAMQEQSFPHNSKSSKQVFGPQVINRSEQKQRKY